MLRGTVKRRTSTRQVARQTRRQHNTASPLPILLLPHVMNRKLDRIVRRRKIHIVNSPIRLSQLALLV